MNILYFHRHFSTPQGSAGTRSYEMARRLAEHSHSVTIMCRSSEGSVTGLDGTFVHGKRQGKVDGIHVIEVNGFYALHASLIALRATYDVAIASVPPLYVSIPGIVAKIFRRKRFIFEMRDLSVVSSKLATVFEWIVYRFADRLIGLSPGIVDAIEKRGIAPSRITMIPNGCDLAVFAAPVSSWRPVEVKADDIMVVYAGAHEKANGLDAALDAAVELKRRGADHIKLVFVGAGAYKATLVARTEQQKLDNVLFLNPIPKVKLAGLLAATDLGMQVMANIPAYYYGPSPNKFFDYLASGTPVLCNYPGWLAELISLHQCGFVVSPANTKAFADALVYASENRTELAAMGPRAQQLGRTAFARDGLADKFCKWIESAFENV